MPRIGTRVANFMPIADRQTRVSLLWLTAFVALWLAGCGAYGGGGNGGGGGGAGPPPPPRLSTTTPEPPGELNREPKRHAAWLYRQSPPKKRPPKENFTPASPAHHRQTPNKRNTKHL